MLKIKDLNLFRYKTACQNVTITSEVHMTKEKTLTKEKCHNSLSLYQTHCSLHSIYVLAIMTFKKFL